MKFYISFVSIIFVLSISTAFAIEPSKNHLMLIGGGGEPTGNTTIFDSVLTRFGEFYQGSKWSSTSVSFNGGHSTTEGLLTKFSRTNTPFTNDSYNKQIETYKEKINSGTIAPGEQLMIVIDSHGAMKYGKQDSHDIATSGSSITDYNSLSGSSTVSLDKLKELTALAKSKGIKMAIVDLSCHSGNSIALGDENTCVVTATGPNHFGYGGGMGTFAYNFVNEMKAGKNLEDIFLEARQTTTDHSYPMISTPQNKSITEFEYNYISPYLFYYDETADKLTPYLITSAKNGIDCQREDGFNKLNKVIDKIEELNTVQKKIFFSLKTVKEVDLSVLRKSIKEYKDIQDGLLRNLKNLHAEKLDIEEEISSSKTGTRMSSSYSWSALLTTNFDKYIQMAQEDLNTNSNDSDAKMRLALYQNAKLRGEQIKRENPGLAQVKTIIKDFDTNTKKTYDLAGTIAHEEKKLYQALYKAQAAKNVDVPNPCKGFVL